MTLLYFRSGIIIRMAYVWPLAVIVIGAIVGSTTKIIMLRMALRDTTPAERPGIIAALFGRQPPTGE